MPTHHTMNASPVAADLFELCSRVMIANTQSSGRSVAPSRSTHLCLASVIRLIEEERCRNH